MSGRVRRKLALADAKARSEDSGGEPPRCALCDRRLGRRIEWHHVVPKSQGGRETVALHPICHRMIHSALDNRSLATTHATLERVRDEPQIARFLRWVADKPPDFHAPTRRAR